VVHGSADADVAMSGRDGIVVGAGVVDVDMSEEVPEGQTRCTTLSLLLCECYLDVPLSTA
jgi:hypothetical protein